MPKLHYSVLLHLFCDVCLVIFSALVIMSAFPELLLKCAAGFYGLNSYYRPVFLKLSNAADWPLLCKPFRGPVRFNIGLHI